MFHYRIALCIDGQRRFTTNKRQLLGKEAIKQRHLKLLGYEVVQVRPSTSVPSEHVFDEITYFFVQYIFYISSRFLTMNLKNSKTRRVWWSICTRKSSLTVTG